MDWFDLLTVQGTLKSWHAAFFIAQLSYPTEKMTSVETIVLKDGPLLAK